MPDHDGQGGGCHADSRSISSTASPVSQDAIGEMSRLGVSSLLIERRHPGDEYGVVTVRDIASRVVAASKLGGPDQRLRSDDQAGADRQPPEMNVKYAIRLLSRFGPSTGRW